LEIFNISYWIFLSFFALSVGSFLNVLISRIPKKLNIAFPASHCPKCQTPLKLQHNIPLFSWFFLKGRCAFCKENISIQYPLIELLTFIIFLSIFYKFGFTIHSLLLSFIFSLTLALSTIDYYEQMVPDVLNLGILTLALFSFDIFTSLPNALLMMGGISLLRFYVSFIVGKEAMGEGDIIFIGTIGAVLGVELSLFTIFLSAVIALPFSWYASRVQAESSVPYIPFLALAFFITLMFDYKIQFLMDRLYE
jgi:leader peptidase (prepilin peptidase)/N-methyltransferase